MTIDSTITGVVLAGGKSVRMGTDKALLVLDGRPLIARIASAMQGVFDRVVLIANDASPYNFLGLESFGDLYRDRGPLGGIHAALSHTKSTAVFVLACDTPFVSIELIQYLIEHPLSAAARIPSMNGRLHPLCGLYTQSCLATIQERLEKQQNRLQDLFDVITTEIIPISSALPFYKENLFANFNNPDDYHSGPDRLQNRS